MLVEKTTPIPVKFDRQGHSCNFYAGLGPTESSKWDAAAKRALAPGACFGAWGMCMCGMLLPEDTAAE